MHYSLWSCLGKEINSVPTDLKQVRIKLKLTTAVLKEVYQAIQNHLYFQVLHVRVSDLSFYKICLCPYHENHWPPKLGLQYKYNISIIKSETKGSVINEWLTLYWKLPNNKNNNNISHLYSIENVLGIFLSQFVHRFLIYIAQFWLYKENSLHNSIIC